MTQRNVFIPPAVGDIVGPLVFLAGPITGAPDWQSKAIDLIRSADAEIFIASPRRAVEREGDFTEDMYIEQVEWEHRHLARAAHEGVTLFWLAKESRHVCERSYAQTTRFELGEAVTVHRLTGAKVVVGIERGFTNERYLRKTLASKTPAIPVLDTLEETCTAAVRLARQ
jgi:hypothetical protein